jgi:hypothetical protein
MDGKVIKTIPIKYARGEKPRLYTSSTTGHGGATKTTRDKNARKTRVMGSREV